MSEVTIWHNPRCSKSRQTLALVEAQGITPTVRRYLDDVPSEAEIRAALAALGLRPIEAIRSGEAEFSARSLSKDSADEVLIRAMAEVPKLIERPIVFAGGKARLGRPPEQVLEIL
ncbi:MAG: arsenate reductase (glutaredoxin) [Rhodobacterales bacterium CG2_30_65_12]|nr:MAG: arsenate reductase (glutaredoxin) [Rhodobacterales bacterium CG2_30_65_12]